MMDSKRNLSLKSINCVSCLQTTLTLYLLVCFLNGCAIGAKQDHHNSDYMDKDDLNNHKKIIKEMSSDNIKNFSKHYTEYPHRAGSWRNKLLGVEMAKVWKEYGFDKTEIFEHKVLLSSPKSPTKIILMEDSKVRKNITISSEPPFGSSEEKGHVIYPTIAFSASANIVAGIVYCNYGLVRDYKELKRLNIKTHDRIFLIRIGEIKDPLKVVIERAMKHGARAIIYFTEPHDTVIQSEKYPNGFTLNEHGVARRLSISRLPFEGDLLSIGYPSKKNYFRAHKSLREDYFYKIPLQKISAATTALLFDFMDNTTDVPQRFKGDVKTNYSLQSGINKTIRLVIENELKDNTSYTVCGSLFGSTEPDRYVMLGNHRDAWAYGAMDPSSGSSVMTEIVRVLGKYKRETGYRPRRSIMVCSWDAEEQGLLGSTEWADENLKFIQQNAIAYLNVDKAVQGNYTVKLKCSDLMVQVIWETMRTINAPENNTITLFKDTCHKQAIARNMTKDFRYPLYVGLGSNTDNAQFSWCYGLGASDYRFTYNDAYFPHQDNEVATYHTRYDSFDWMKKFVDPTYRYHLTLGKLWLTHALILADRKIIPFDLRRYVDRMKASLTVLEIDNEKELSKHNVSFKFAKSKIRKLIKQVIVFQKTIKDLKLKKLGFYITRAINDRISNFGKQFQLKTNVGSTTLQQIYYNNHYPGIRAALTKDGTNADNINKEITLFVWCVDMAIDLLDISELRLDRQ